MSVQDEISTLCNELGVTPQNMLEMTATHGSDEATILAELKRLRVDRKIATLRSQFPTMPESFFAPFIAQMLQEAGL